MWAVLALGIAFFCIVYASARRKPIGERTRIDGYDVHTSFSQGGDEQGMYFCAELAVELGADDISVEPDFVVQRSAIKVPMSYDLLRWTIHQRLTTHERAAIDFAAKDMVLFAKALTAASQVARERLFAETLGASSDRRLKSLLDLIRQFPRSEETKRAAAAALLDDSMPIRLHGAMFLEEEGLEIVEAIAADETAPVELRLLGLRHRGRAVDRTRYGALIDRLLDSRAPEIREAAIYAYADLAGENGIDRLAAMLADAPPPVIAEAIARAFGRIRSPHAEPALLALLDAPDLEESVLVAAAQALSRVGSTAALTRLLEVLEQRELGDMTQQVLRAAVDVLRDDRRPNAGGHLSVVGEQRELRGGLSFQDRSSALSFPEED